MDNSRQWPSFDNFSAFFAEHILSRAENMALIATAIQRWWRSRKFGIPAEPLKFGLRPVNLARLSYNIRKNSTPIDLNIPVMAWEKLDGTNLGISSSGMKYGRRTQLGAETETYQRCSLRNLSPPSSVAAVRAHLEGEVGRQFPDFIIYGELMCNPQKHAYIQRGFRDSWLAFGIVIKGNLEGKGCNIGRRLAGFICFFPFEPKKIDQNWATGSATSVRRVLHRQRAFRKSWLEYPCPSA